MEDEQMVREHYLHVAVAKFLFLHPEHGGVSVRDPIKLADAKKYGLSPLLLYCVAAAGLPIRWLTFSPLGQPKPLRAILQQAWAGAEGLRGRPDVLRVNQHLAANCPELAADLKKIGVRLALTDAKDKAHPASLRSAQDDALRLRAYAKSSEAEGDPILSICRAAWEEHHYCAQRGSHITAPRDVRARIDQWLALAPQDVGQLPDRGLDWTPGSWLSAWQASVPPDQPRHFHPDSLDGRMWLFLGRGADGNLSEDYDLPIEDGYAAVSELARPLVECWPNSPAEIAASVGVTLKQLQWFVAGKADVEPEARQRLEALLGIGFDDRSGYLAAIGPYTLIARKAQALEAVYTEISHGGDACPWELLPNAGSADPSWRYILLNTFGSPPSIVMVPRGDKIAVRLNELILNFAGPLSVARSFYLDVVSTCAKACLTPDANVRFMEDFAARHHRHWIHGAWQPE